MRCPKPVFPPRRPSGRSRAAYSRGCATTAAAALSPARRRRRSCSSSVTRAARVAIHHLVSSGAMCALIARAVLLGPLLVALPTLLAQPLPHFDTLRLAVALHVARRHPQRHRQPVDLPLFVRRPLDELVHQLVQPRGEFSQALLRHTD